MKISRRDALQLGAVAGAGALLAGCSRLPGSTRVLPASVELPPGPTQPAVRVLNRLGFGPAPGQVAEYTATGYAAHLERQLAADLDEPWDLTLRLRRLEVYAFEPGDLVNFPEEEVLRQLQQAAILQAVYSPNQLRERMVEFWSNHFNIHGRKGHAAFRKGRDDTSVIREHALGTFKAMIRASAQSPAMLFYLDNQFNRRGVPNENYARELMELHTLGVHGGYTQEDVREVARCFTGWGVETRAYRYGRGRFRFDPDLHDHRPKRVLGHTIDGGGIKDGFQVLDLLATHPSTARFLATKLSRYFLGEATTDAVERGSKAFLSSGGDIRSTLRALLTEQAVLEGPPIVRRPVDFAVAALRALHADTDGGKGIQDHLEAMGQPLFQWPMPDGYPDKSEAWTGSLLARWNFALALTRGDTPGTRVDLDGLLGFNPGEKSAARIVSLVHGEHPETPTGSRLASIFGARPDPTEQAALALCAPEFQWR
ncbi:MAG TPA: DUF1800 domain-containing protein [Fimbriimonadaceae bacterium]|nr:DUF1800 domain-containing protein [Fimbriimonadaceae bacterium]